MLTAEQANLVHEKCHFDEKHEVLLGARSCFDNLVLNANYEGDNYFVKPWHEVTGQKVRSIAAVMEGIDEFIGEVIDCGYDVGYAYNNYPNGTPTFEQNPWGLIVCWGDHPEATCAYLQSIYE